MHRRLITKLITIFAMAMLAFGSIVMAASPAQAQGETYNWQGAVNTSAITGQGGGYKQATTFNQASDSATAATYTANVLVTCNNVASTTTLKLSLDKASGSTQNTTQSPSGTLSYDAQKADCLGHPDTQVTISTSGAATPTNGTQVAGAAECNGDQLSWILCPTYKFVLDSVRSVEQNVIVPFLKVEPIVTNDQSSSTYQVWNAVRGVANALFVIVFLYMIGASVFFYGSHSSYNVKSVLPRLVWATIFVQFSYLFMALAIDFTNIVGAGIGDLLLSPIKGHNVVTITNLVGGLGIAGGIAAAVAAAGSILSGAIIIVLISAFFAVMAVFFTLVTRQILITLLVVVAPLAMVAWVLPNTNRWFDKWLKSLAGLLLMYPIIVMLFVSGSLFGAAASSTTGSGAASSEIRSLISVVANIIPLFLIPLTFKYAGAALGAVGGLVATLHGKTKSATEGSGAYERLKSRTHQRKRSLAAGQGVSVLGANIGTGQGTAKLFGKKAGGAVGRGFSQVGRGAYSSPGQGSNVRAMAAFIKDRNDWKKRLEEEGMTYDGYQALSKGKQWYDTELVKIEGKIQTARATGNTAAVTANEEARTNLMDGWSQATRYSNNAMARSAAMSQRASIEVVDDADVAALREYTQHTKAGSLIARQTWNSAREGVRKSGVHLTFTDINGALDREGLKSFVAKKNQATWVNYTPDAYKVMQSTGILHDFAADAGMRHVLRGMLHDRPGTNVAAPIEQIIRDELGINTPATFAND